MNTGTLAPGALVSARGRDWVVLPRDEADVIRLRPVDGTELDAIGLFEPIDGAAVSPATYPLPDPSAAGDFTGARLVYDAVRLNLRSGAGPFRSLGRLSVEPRPYQYVPLLMALRLDPVRLLIADDVGVGKTIEAGMVARELLDRGAVRRIAVLCAPHLCEQWAEELETKFHIDATVVQSSTMARLERGLPPGDIGVFRHYPHLVASIDFVKSDRWRQYFIDDCPDLLIVDEAHTAARPRGDHGGRQQRRYELLRDLAQDPARNIILTTATPHSGIEEGFRSLLGLLDAAFDRDGGTEVQRRRLSPHIIQRRRADLERWLGEETPFPERESAEHEYALSADYAKLFDDVLAYCRESVAAAAGGAAQQRVRYWAAIAILRCLLSSPAAAEAMLEKRAEKVVAEGPQDAAEADDRYGRQVLDSADDDQPPDYVPAAALDDSRTALTRVDLRRLDGFLKRAQSLAGVKTDDKLRRVVAVVDGFLADGFRPIVFCRFIATARYVAEHLQQQLAKKHKGLHVRSVSGDDGGSVQREEIVRELAGEPIRVLVATDCLSEGVNLQQWFDAVLHYDLPWNPNRLEQREGRVDRYGQAKKTVRTGLLFGANNQIDLVVLRVLIEKARTIRRRLGISVPVPVESEQVVQAVIESVLLHDRAGGEQLRLALEDRRVSELHEQMEQSAERELQRRGHYAQAQLDPDAVRREVDAVRQVIGTPEDVRRFVGDAIQRFNGQLSPTGEDGVYALATGNLADNLNPLLEAKNGAATSIAFEGLHGQAAVVLGRNHPAVERLASAVFGRALTGTDAAFARAGAIFTDVVTARTAVLLLRLRYQLRGEADIFAEEVLPVAFSRQAGERSWLTPHGDAALALMRDAKPVANMSAEDRERQVAWALGMLGDGWFRPLLDERAASGPRRRPRPPPPHARSSRRRTRPRSSRTRPTCWAATSSCREAAPDGLDDSITIEGGLFPPDLVERVAAGAVGGQSPADFGLAKGRRLSDEVQAAFSDARSFWDAFQRRLDRSRESKTTLTRQDWVIPLLEGSRFPGAPVPARRH